MSLLPGTGEGKLDTLPKGDLYPVFRQMRGGERTFSALADLLFFNCLQLEIIRMLKWYIWGQYVLIPFINLSKKMSREAEPHQKISTQCSISYYQVGFVWG